MSTRRGTLPSGRRWAAIEATPGMWLLGFGTQVTEAIVRAPYGDRLPAGFLPAGDPRITSWSIVLCNTEAEKLFADSLDLALAQAADYAEKHL